MRTSTQRLTSEDPDIISVGNYGSANTLANSPVPGRILSRWDYFLQLSGGVCQQTVLQPSTADVAPLGVEEMTAGSWCIVAPLGTTAAALALKDRFQETSQTFFSLLCCHRHLGQPRSHHISSKCESRPSSLWTPGDTSTTLLSDQTRPSSGSFFFGASKARVKKKVFSSFFCQYLLLTLCCRGGTISLIDPECCSGFCFQTYLCQNTWFIFWRGVVILRVPDCLKYTDEKVNVEWHISMHFRRGCTVAALGIGGFPASGPSHKVPHWFAFP